MLVTETVNQFNIVYDTEYTHSVREYYLYCVELYKQAFQLCDWSVNVIFGEFDYDFKNGLPTKRIVLQYEHTLVKPGGRDTEGFSRGKVKIGDSNETYLVRLVNYDLIKRSDLVVEYSIPNKVNVLETNLFPHYNYRHVNIAPCLYDIDLGKDRRMDVATNFYDSRQPRRAEMLARLGHLNVRNYTNFYGSNLAKLYSSVKVLVNIHQTDHHDTLEELRVLPALRRGAIIVAERSALKEHIPYEEHVVWADYDEIPHVVERILKDYDLYREHVFGGDTLVRRLERLEQHNRAETRRSLVCLR